MSLLEGMAKALDVLTDSKSTKMAINVAIKEYGQIKDLRINREEGKISTSILLKGEETPITVEIENYRIINDQETGKKFVMEKASSDRA